MKADEADDLDAARSAMEATDREIVALIARRFALSQIVGAAREGRGLTLRDPAREAAVLRDVAATARAAGLDAEIVRQIFWCIIGLCRSDRVEAV